MIPAVAVAVAVVGIAAVAAMAGGRPSSSEGVPSEGPDDAGSDTHTGGTMRTISRLVIHHTAASATAWPWSAIVLDHTSDGYTWKGKELTGRGWSAVGYHFGVDPDGTVHEGRDPSIVGAHAKGANSDSIGIAMVGKYSDASPPPEALLDALADLVEELLDEHGLTLNDVYGHREVGTTHTECPGVSPDWLREELKTRISATTGSTT